MRESKLFYYPSVKRFFLQKQCPMGPNMKPYFQPSSPFTSLSRSKKTKPFNTPQAFSAPVTLFSHSPFSPTIGHRSISHRAFSGTVARNPFWSWSASVRQSVCHLTPFSPAGYFLTARFTLTRSRRQNANRWSGWSNDNAAGCGIIFPVPYRPFGKL